MAFIVRPRVRAS